MAQFRGGPLKLIKVASSRKRQARKSKQFNLITFTSISNTAAAIIINLILNYCNVTDPDLVTTSA